MYIQLVFRIIDKDEKMHVPFIEIYICEVDIGFTTVTEFSALYRIYSNPVKIPIPLNSTTGVQQQK